MADRKIDFLAVVLVLAGLWATVAEPVQAGILEDHQDQQTLYFRKLGGQRFLDPAPGNQAVNENVFGSLYLWGDYVADRPFLLDNLSMELHLDATIVSATAVSKIKVALTRNGKTVYSSGVYELPAGPSGPRQIDILTDEALYPGLTFTEGDELAFYFQQILNLNSCQFRYNGSGARDDSHLALHLAGVDYPVVGLSPASMDISVDMGGSADTSFDIINEGYKRMQYDLDLPQGQQTLSYGSMEDTSYCWTISDQYDQDFFNVRFTPAQTCTLKSARLLFSADSSQGGPDLTVYVWDDESGFPGAKLDSAVVPNSSLNFSPDWQVVNFSGRGLLMKAHEDFHIGYTVINRNPGDALAICSDDGLPVGNQRRSSGRWGDDWETMYEQHDMDANFFIQATVKYGVKPSWLSHDPPPSSLAPYATHHIQVFLDAAGLAKGVYRSGVIIANSSPDPLVILPVTLRVGQTDVVGDENPASPERHVIMGNHPNPFNAGTRIRYRVGAGEGHLFPVHLSIYNTLGQRVRGLIDGHQPPGEYGIWWDGRSDDGTRAASGIYFCRLQIGQLQKTGKMLLLR